MFVAKDDELHREVAVKQIQDRHVRPSREPVAILARGRDHRRAGASRHRAGLRPGALRRGRPFYAMRFIKGDSLKEAIERFHQARQDRPQARASATLELQKLLRRFLDVCNAIAYAHSRGVLHRDIKPGNIMLGQYGETLVVDWGLAKVVGTGEGRRKRRCGRRRPAGPRETLPGSAIGTPAYMSPEQAAGRLDQLGPASDVYSLGATLYYLLTGKPPIEGTGVDVEAVLERVRTGRVSPAAAGRRPTRPVRSRPSA